jgi:hypothetical protein
MKTIITTRLIVLPSKCRVFLIYALCLCLIGTGTTALVGCGGGGGASGGELGGVWRAVYNDPTTGTAQIELILQDNGNFQQQTLAGTGALITIFGNWQILPNNVLRLNIERGEPTQTCGPLGCTKVLYPAGETHNYAQSGANLRTTLISCASNPACTINYTRAN